MQHWCVAVSEEAFLRRSEFFLWFFGRKGVFRGLNLVVWIWPTSDVELRESDDVELLQYTQEGRIEWQDVRIQPWLLWWPPLKKRKSVVYPGDVFGQNNQPHRESDISTSSGVIKLVEKLPRCAVPRSEKEDLEDRKQTRTRDFRYLCRSYYRYDADIRDSISTKITIFKL